MAHTVGLRPGDLFASLEPEAVVSQPDDVATEAAIARHGDVIGRDDLATALGWSPARLLDALEVLDRWLAGTGIRLRRTGWDRYTLEPSASALPGEHVRRLARVRGASTFLVAPDAARPGQLPTPPAVADVGQARGDAAGIAPSPRSGPGPEASPQGGPRCNPSAPRGGGRPCARHEPIKEVEIALPSGPIRSVSPSGGRPTPRSWPSRAGCSASWWGTGP